MKNKRKDMKTSSAEGQLVNNVPNEDYHKTFNRPIIQSKQFKTLALDTKEQRFAMFNAVIIQT